MFLFENCTIFQAEIWNLIFTLTTGFNGTVYDLTETVYLEIRVFVICCEYRNFHTEFYKNMVISVV